MGTRELAPGFGQLIHSWRPG